VCSSGKAGGDGGSCSGAPAVGWLGYLHGEVGKEVKAAGDEGILEK
jgi:hypothetical protein